MIQGPGEQLLASPPHKAFASKGRRRNIVRDLPAPAVKTWLRVATVLARSFESTKIIRTTSWAWMTSDLHFPAPGRERGAFVAKKPNSSS